MTNSEGYYIEGSNSNIGVTGVPAIGTPYNNNRYINLVSKSVDVIGKPMIRSAVIATQKTSVRDYRCKTKTAEVINIQPTYYITPKFKDALFYSAPNKTVIFKGPIKSALVNNVSDKQNIGNVVGNVGAMEFKFSINQFVSIGVDVPNSKAQGLPQGFVFTNNTITGKSERAGTYTFSLVSESTVIPVTFKVTNLTRIF